MKYLVMPLGVLFVSQAFAAGTVNDCRWVTTLSGGPVWENAGKSQTFYLAPNIQKTFSANKTTNALADGELFVGIQNNLPNAFLAQWGLAFAVTDSAKLSGNIWDDADPTFNNYTYNYKIQHTHLALKGKLLFDQGCGLIPWMSASVGLGWNRSYGYQNNPLSEEAVTTSNFGAYTKKSFTYTAGVGVQKPLNQHWQIGAGYEFANWGQSQLGAAPGQTTNSRLRLNHLFTNGVMFNLSYLA